MLFITRKVTEKVMLSNEVELQIVKIEEDRVQIGITAPPDVPIHRIEVVRKINAKKAKRAAEAKRKQESEVSD